MKIEQVEKIPDNINYNEWLAEEGKKIEEFIKYKSGVYELKKIISDTPCVVLTRFKEFDTDNYEKRVQLEYHIRNSYYPTLTKAFYEVNNWELPEQKIYKMFKDLKEGEYFQFADNHYGDGAFKFIGYLDNTYIFKQFNANFVGKYLNSLDIQYEGFNEVEMGDIFTNRIEQRVLILNKEKTEAKISKMNNYYKEEFDAERKMRFRG